MRSNYHMAGGPQCTGMPAPVKRTIMTMMNSKRKIASLAFFFLCAASSLLTCSRNLLCSMYSLCVIAERSVSHG